MDRQKELPVSRYLLSISKVNLLFKLQIYSSCVTSSERTGIDDICNLLRD